MCEFTIEKNIPLIPKRGGREKYPFKQMAVGDSFVVDANFAKARSSSFKYGKRNSKRFASRKLAEGLRIWRIE